MKLDPPLNENDLSMLRAIRGRELTLDEIGALHTTASVNGRERALQLARYGYFSLVSGMARPEKYKLSPVGRETVTTPPRLL